MKLSLLNELQTPFNLKKELSYGKTRSRMAPKTHETAWIGQKGPRFSGSKDRVQISFDANDKNVTGYVSHTHPIDGEPTPLRSLPSIQDLESCINFTLSGGQDYYNQQSNEVTNPGSDIEGMIIWNGDYYTAVIPSETVKLTKVNEYQLALQNRNVEEAIRALEAMGFIVEHGQA